VKPRRITDTSLGLVCLSACTHACKGSSIQTRPKGITHACLTKPHKFIVCLTESLKHWMPFSWNSIGFRDSSVGRATSYGLDGRGSVSGQEAVLFSIASIPALGPTQPHIQLVPAALFLGIKRPCVKLTTHLCLVLRSRTTELYLHSPIGLDGVVLNWLGTGTTLLFTFLLNFSIPLGSALLVCFHHRHVDITNLLLSRMIVNITMSAVVWVWDSLSFVFHGLPLFPLQARLLMPWFVLVLPCFAPGHLAVEFIQNLDLQQLHSGWFLWTLHHQ
jgi:hypothetical protein